MVGRVGKRGKVLFLIVLDHERWLYSVVPGFWRNFFRERGGMLGCTVRPHADSPSNRSAKAARLIQEA